jgi:hypothetical protein
MNDTSIRFASVFLCPAPCKAEVPVERNAGAICRACGKEFDPIEITELLLSQGRFFTVKENERDGDAGSLILPGHRTA